jgi:long-chain-fatty-acid--CoA ligase ACSBG
MVSAAAPIAPETKKYFMSLDMPLGEAFGMSETSGAHCVAFPRGIYNFDTIGKPLQGVQTKILNPDETGSGEIMIKGRHVFQGYIFDEAKTMEALDEDGWMHTGDIGKVDEHGFIYITGRIKELIITAGGENIPPVHIEHLVKGELPVLSNAFLVGDKRKFLTMLVSLKTEMELETGAPKDELSAETLKWIDSLGLKYTKLSEILAAGPDKTVLKAIEDGIARANKSSISNAQKIQKFAILPHDFSVPTGELGEFDFTFKNSIFP